MQTKHEEKVTIGRKFTYILVIWYFWLTVNALIVIFIAVQIGAYIVAELIVQIGIHAAAMN